MSGCRETARFFRALSTTNKIGKNGGGGGGGNLTRSAAAFASQSRRQHELVVGIYPRDNQTHLLRSDLLRGHLLHADLSRTNLLRLRGVRSYVTHSTYEPLELQRTDLFSYLSQNLDAFKVGSRVLVRSSICTCVRKLKRTKGGWTDGRTIPFK